MKGGMNGRTVGGWGKRKEDRRGERVMEKQARGNKRERERGEERIVYCEHVVSERYERV